MIFGKALTNVQTLMWSWREGKIFLEHSVAFSQDALHVVAGVVVLLATALLLRKPISDKWPWLTVFLLTFVNEYIDIAVEKWPDPAMQYGEGFKDLLLTMFLPSVLMLTGRFLPGLYQAVPASPETQHGESHRHR